MPSKLHADMNELTQLRGEGKFLKNIVGTLASDVVQTNTASAQTSDKVTHCLRVLCALVAEHSDQLTVYYVLSKLLSFAIYVFLKDINGLQWLSHCGKTLRPEGDTTAEIKPNKIIIHLADYATSLTTAAIAAAAAITILQYNKNNTTSLVQQRHNVVFSCHTIVFVVDLIALNDVFT
uniref:Uncharacterized protein n=1 Tax=Glossina pallidipes TaxID=7398 RepID=A0A1A9ZC08_GLOPL